MYYGVLVHYLYQERAPDASLHEVIAARPRAVAELNPAL